LIVTETIGFGVGVGDGVGDVGVAIETILVNKYIISPTIAIVTIIIMNYSALQDGGSPRSWVLHPFYGYYFTPHQLTL